MVHQLTKIARLISMASVVLISPMALKAQLNLDYAALTIPDTMIKNANEVVRDEVQIFKVKSNKEGSFYYKKTITILNKSSNSNILVVPYDKQSKVGKIQATVYDAIGKLVRKVEKSEIQDISAISSFSIYEDDRVKYIEINYPTYPFTVEFEYEIVQKGISYCMYPDWQIQKYHSAVQQSTFVVDMPADLKLYYRALNTDIKPQIDNAAGRVVYTWKAENKPAVRREPLGPEIGSVLPILLTAPDQFQIDNYQGSMATWKEYGAFVDKLYEGRDQLPPDMADWVKKITADAPTNKEKINALYQFMQKNMRYVSVQLGIGGWQPFDAEFVSTKKYGDCKALTNFMKAALKEVGIKAYPALIYAGSPFLEVQPGFTKPIFNHVILNIPSENYWLECTSQTDPPNYLGSQTADHYALLITENGGELIRTPKLTPADNSEQHQVVVTLSSDGSAELKVNSSYTGSRQETLRYLCADNTTKEFREWLAEETSLPAFDLKDLVTRSSPDHPECTLQASFLTQRYSAKAGKRLFVPLNALYPKGEIPPAQENRRQAVVLDEPFSVTDSIILSLPKGYKIENIPSDHADLHTDYASYQLQITQEADQVTLVRHFELQATQLPAASYEDYRNFCREVAKMETMKMVLVGE